MNVDKEGYCCLFAVASRLEPPLEWRSVTFAPDKMADMKITPNKRFFDGRILS